MDRRQFVKKSAAIALGAGIASGIASGFAEVVAPSAARPPDRDEGDRSVRVLTGEVVEVRRMGSSNRLDVDQTLVALQTDEGRRQIRFYNVESSRYPGPNFDLDRVEQLLPEGSTARIAVHKRPEIGGFDALMIVGSRP